MKSIYWFKRDLRIEDNRPLAKCLKDSTEVYPIFIFDPQILKKLNSFDNRLYFIKLCLENLNKSINLNIFYGETEKIIEYLIKKLKIRSIFTSQSLSWEGEERNLKIKKLCQKLGVNFIEIFDNFLVDVRKMDYTKIYTHFYQKWKLLIDYKITKIDKKLLIKTKKINIDKFQLPNKILSFEPNNQFYWTIEFLNRRLKEFDFKNYSLTRNFLYEDGTSKLSPYIRFGVISIRLIYNKLKDISEDFIKELAWREFWYHIKYYFPELKNLEFQEKRRNLKWQNNEKYLEAFVNAKTGYPIIDAAIIQLKTENWMHNRARMIVGSFLTKDLMIDWRIGEKFFSKYLIDYDEVVNVGNWQWIASVGPDPKPLRIFNPIIQVKKFDPNLDYVLKYLPNLNQEDKKAIIDPLKYRLKNYYPPIINHYEILKKIKNFYYKI